MSLVSVKLKGLEDIQNILDSLPERAKRQFIRKGLRNGAALMVRSAKSKARRRSGNLANSIASRQEMSKKKQTITFVVFPRRGKDFPGGYYAHLVERGHNIVVRKRRAFGNAKAVVGHTRAFPFMRPAFEENAEKVIDIANESMREMINQPIRAKL